MPVVGNLCNSRSPDGRGVGATEAPTLSRATPCSVDDAVAPVVDGSLPAKSSPCRPRTWTLPYLGFSSGKLLPISLLVPSWPGTRHGCPQLFVRPSESARP